jgi:mRNA interferase MazF
MDNFRRGDVVRVPFPYTDRSTRQHRPALVVSQSHVGEGNALLWVVMITSAENRRWPHDLEIMNLTSAGLPAPSVIRPSKIATIEARHAEVLGEIESAAMARVADAITTILGLVTDPLKPAA